MPETFNTEELLAMSKVALDLQEIPDAEMQLAVLLIARADELMRNPVEPTCTEGCGCHGWSDRVRSSVSAFFRDRRLAMLEHLASGDTLCSIQLRARRFAHA